MKTMRCVLFAVAIAAVNSQFAVRSYASLFKIDFGQFENEREIVDADGNPTGTFPEPLTNWTVIPTWTFADPNANVVVGSASAVGTTNADGTEVTWKLTDFSTDANTNVTMTMLDNKALAEQHTGNYSGVNASGVALPLGQPRTVTVTVKAGEYLWFAEMEDNSGGISGMIIRSAALPVVDVSASKGLFKLDFGQFENEREIVDADGNPTGTFPEPLTNWTVIPTWTFTDPNANVVVGSASAVGTAN